MFIRIMNIHEKIFPIRIVIVYILRPRRGCLASSESERGRLSWIRTRRTPEVMSCIRILIVRSSLSWSPNGGSGDDDDGGGQVLS